MSTRSQPYETEAVMINSPCAMLNIPKSKIMVKISKISNISFLQFLFNTQSASPEKPQDRPSRDQGQYSRGKGQDSRGHMFWPQGQEASRF